jgi:phosphatidylglycerol:prolipoprotein diacylglycerol transferase
MYPALPFGPITLPTGPIFALFAVFLGLETAGRYGRKLGLRVDDVWNTGLIAVLAGLIVARLWNVFQFWPVYAAEPLLVLSLRPGGFALWPGLVGALVGGYGYLLYKALDPLRVGAALSVGLLMAGGVLSVSEYLTGAVTGLPSSLPWARPYYGELQHPVGLYQAVGFLIGLALVWIYGDRRRPGRVILLAGLATGLVLLVAGGFAANDAVFGALRVRQVAGFLLALVCAGALAWTARTPSTPVTT